MGLLETLYDWGTVSMQAQMILGGLAAATAALAAFVYGGRAWRKIRIRRYDAVALGVHTQWRGIVRGSVASDSWRNDPMKRRVVQSILVQEIGAASDKDRAGLQEFLRSSGLLTLCIAQARAGHGWGRRRAMLALGGMRVPEAVAVLSEGLDDWQLDTRLTAVRALGLTGLPAAASPIVESLMVEGLKVPPEPVTNALVRCYGACADGLLSSIRRAHGHAREMLARVAAEIATPAMADEMILLAGDGRPEVRACAARGLAAAPLTIAVPALADLARDEVWFVRLRATAALDQLKHPRTIPVLLEAVRDPNRMVRTRAAAALSQFEQNRVEILNNVVQSRDRYALHSIISALELAGGFEKVMENLSDPLRHDETAEHLLEALREGAASLWSTRPADPVIESVFP